MPGQVGGWGGGGFGASRTQICRVYLYNSLFTSQLAQLAYSPPHLQVANYVMYLYLIQFK